MKTKHFLENPHIHHIYDRWVNGPYLFTRGYYERKLLFEFVSACVYYVKHSKFIRRGDAWRKIDLDVFRESLREDLSKQNLPDLENRVGELYAEFEYLLNYEKFLDERY